MDDESLERILRISQSEALRPRFLEADREVKVRNEQIGAKLDQLIRMEEHLYAAEQLATEIGLLTFKNSILGVRTSLANEICGALQRSAKTTGFDDPAVLVEN